MIKVLRIDGFCPLSSNHIYSDLPSSVVQLSRTLLTALFLPSPRSRLPVLVSYLESSTVCHMTRTMWAAFCLLKFQFVYVPCSVENKVKLLEAPHVIKILHWISLHRVIHLTIIQTDISVLHQRYGEGRAKTTPIGQKGLGALYSFQSGSTNEGSAY